MTTNLTFDLDHDLDEANAPPKPPRSAFICFSDSKRAEIMKHRSVTQTKDVLKIVAEEWRNLSDRDRAFWDEEARNDKVRYVREKAEYKGPWNLPKRRAKKHPMAPKRPMSAFLKFSQKRRTTVKENNPDMSNTDVSRLLGEMWRNASATERAPYIEQEEQERSKYKEDIKRWRDEQTKSDSAIRVTYQAMPHAPESYAVHEPSLPDHDGVSIEPISFNQPGDSFSSSCSSVFRSQKAPIADATNRHHGGLRNYTERIVMKDSNLHAYGTSSQGSLVYGHRYRQPYYEPVHQFRHQYTHGSAHGESELDYHESPYFAGQHRRSSSKHFTDNYY